jgi:hypothetical protein
MQVEPNPGFHFELPSWALGRWGCLLRTTSH